MEITMAGNDGGGVLLVALILASRLGPLFVILGVALSISISVIAFKKKIKWVAAAFSFPPIVYLISGFFQYLALSRMTNTYSIVSYICTVIFSLTMLMPYIVILSIILKFKKSSNKEP